MSDFTSNFWSVYVAAITVLGILACVALLWISGKTKATTAHDNSTGHVWDGDLRELNNPLPRWWVWLFIITIVFSAVYLVLFPGLGNFAGKLGWSQTDQWQKEVDAGNKATQGIYAKFLGMTPEQVSQNPEAMKIGDRLFMNNCAQCHGSNAKGSKGFPNLTDGDWLYGGHPDQIKETIMKGRTGIMTPMGEALGSPEDVKNMAHYVLSLSGSSHDAARAAQAKDKFAVCAACHGPDGKGNQAIGAPNLTDKIWLHGGTPEAIIKQINEGKTNVMPPQGHNLTEGQVHVLVSYVCGLSKGCAVPAPAAAAPAAAADEGASVKVEDGVVKFFFASGKADVADGGDKALAEVVAGVAAGKKAVISGYVDSTGNAAQNEELAKQRAFAVRDLLKAQGVAEDKIELKKPENTDAGAGAQARRVEVVLM